MPTPPTGAGAPSSGSAVSLYLRYTGISIRSQMQYAASFWMLIVGQLLATGLEFLAIWALFDRFGSLRGWTLPEVALFYGIVNVSFALAEGIGQGFDTFHALVKSGDFDRLLLRPRSTALQVASQEIGLSRTGRLAQGLIVLLWAMAALPVAWSPARIFLLISTILGGGALFYGLLILQASLSFWTIETLELMNTVTYGATETGQYPLSIYRPWFRRFFTFVVPLACLNIIPATALLPYKHLQGLPTWLPWAAPLAGILFLAGALQVWKLGVRHYTSTGS